MQPSKLPGLNGYFTNTLALNRQIARSIGFIESYRVRNNKEPAAAAALVAWLDAAKAYINAGVIAPPGP